MSETNGRELADRGSLLLVALVALSHGLFLLEDDRWPRDRGLYYDTLPRLYERLGSLEGVPDVLWALTERGGWYNAMEAVLLRVFGRYPDVFAAPDVVWVVAVVALCGLVARARGGPIAGLAAVGLVGAAPVVIVTGRMSWIHTPETALVLAIVAVLVYDPALARARSVAAVGACGALALALRPSALVWVVTTIPMLIPAWREGRRRRVLVVGLAWALALFPALDRLGMYMEAKVEARERYLEQVSGLAEQILAVWGVPMLVVGVVGLFFALRSASSRTLLGAVLLSWIAVPMGLFLLFRAGLDNFPLIAPGLGILAALGFSERPRGAVAAVAVFLLFHTPQYFGSIDRTSPMAPVFAVLQMAPSAHQGNYYMPLMGSGDAEVFELLAATCPHDPEAPCPVAVDQGLFEPYSEDPGNLELFLGGWRRVRVYPLHEPADTSQWPIVALANFHCQGGDELWRQRYPQSMRNLRALLNRLGMMVAWQGPPREDHAKIPCSRLWFTPGGRVARPQLLPPMRRVGRAGAVPGVDNEPMIGPGQGHGGPGQGPGGPGQGPGGPGQGPGGPGQGPDGQGPGGPGAGGPRGGGSFGPPDGGGAPGMFGPGSAPGADPRPRAP